MEANMTINDFSLLVTGNGFDLALNLPTKYDDFLNIIKKAKSAKE